MTSLDPELLLAQTAWLRRLAMRLVGDPHVAEDVVQDTWVAALEQPPRDGQHPGRLRRWLSVVAQNAARMRQRSEVRRRAREYEAARPPEDQTPMGIDESARAQQRLLAAVMALPKADREVVILRFLDGMPPRAIAKRLGCTSAAVRSRLSRALGILRAQLSGLDSDRHGLVLALLPLLQQPGLTVPNLLHATWIMNAASKTALVTIAVGLGVAAMFWWPSSEDPRDPHANAGDPNSAVAATASIEGSTTPETSPTAGNMDRTEAAPTEQSAPPPTKRVATDATLVATARCVDEDGNPIAGATLTAAQVVDRPQAVTDTEGRVTLEVPWPAKLTEGNHHWLVVEATAKRRVVLTRQERVQGKGRVALALGDLVLGLGAALSGTVRDSDGSPLANARVWAVRGTTPANGPVEEARLMYGRGFVGLGHGVWSWANTDATGQYRFAGLPVGSVSVVGRKPGRTCAYTSPVQLTPGANARAPDLRLGKVPTKNTITGLVRDSAGQPLTGARIEVFENRGARNIDPITSTRSGEPDGAFTVTVLSNQEYTLEVSQRGAGKRSLLRHDIAAGTRDLIVQFAAPRRFELVLTGPDGASVEPTGAYAYDENGAYLELGWEKGEDGERIPLAPNQTFTLWVHAKGYLRKQLGPFQPDSVPARIVAELQPAGTVSGRVLANGQPVAGAKVHAHYVDPRQPFMQFAHKVYTRLGRSRGAIAETDERGQFTLTILRDGNYVVHAEAVGHGRGESHDLALTATGQAPPISIALAASGTITGRVLVGPGDSAEGQVVAATRGNGHAETCVTDETGGFRFESLAPGGWQVRICKTDDLEWLRMARTWPTSEIEALPTDVQLAPGQDAMFDIDLRSRTSAHVTGNLTFGGASCSGWRVSMWRDGEYLFTKTDTNGRFELRGAAGKTTMHFFSRLPAGGQLQVQRPLTLIDGHNTANLDIRTGGLELISMPASAPPPAEGRTEGYALVWQSSDDQPHFTYRFDPDASGTHRATALPAGQAELRRRQNNRTRVENWETISTVRVTAGDMTSVTVR